MPGLICGRRNDGKLCLSDGSGLYCRHAGPIDVLGRGCYRKEALRMVSFATLKGAIKCREWLKNNGFRAFVQEFYDENGRFYAVVEY